MAEANTPNETPVGSSMRVRLSLRSTIAYLHRYFLRRDIFILLMIMLLALHTVAQVVSFLLLAASLRSMVTAAELSFSGITLPGVATPMQGFTVGIALLGLAVIFRVASLFTAIKTGSTFGASIIFKLAPQWDSASLKQRRYVFRLSQLAAFTSRLVYISLAPTAMFFAGLIFLATIDLIVAAALLGLGLIALFAFIPSNLLDARNAPTKFDANIEARNMMVDRAAVERAVSRKLRQFRGRQLIKSVNLFLLFMALALVTLFVDLAWAVEHYAETIVLILIVARSSIMSLTNIAVMLRLIGVNADGVGKMIAILDHGTMPEPGDIVADDESEDE